MTITHNRSLPALSLLLLALAACNAEQTPAPADDVATTQRPASPTDSAPADSVPPPVEPTPTTPRTPAPADDLARFDGYGDMRFGMTAAQARQAWGGELKGIAAEGEACYHLSPKWVKAPAELAFMIEGDKFVRYSSEDAKLVAPGGGRIGMAQTEIEALYPGRVEVQPHKYSDGKYLRIKDTSGNAVLIFETDAKGMVDEFRVGVPPQVDYVEGCS
jgi:hypothetical protein